MSHDPELLPRAEVLERLPVVALVGRPNTGKSTLFNRLTRSRRAVVAPTPGVTRDRNIAVASYDDRRFLVVDTGGFEAEEQEELLSAVRTQSLIAAQEADAVIAVLDGRAGLNPLDTALIGQLRRLKKPLFFAVNKIDTAKQEDYSSEFYALGIDTLYPISAEHGVNVSVLMDAVIGALPEPVEVEQSEDGSPQLAVAIIGRPNVGKSSLVNRLVGYERSIVTAIPGTTRDALDTTVTHKGRGYVLVDTAGVRRRPRVQEHVERASAVRALRALERADLAVLVIDLIEGMTEQDARIAGYAWERGRGLILVLNKSDAVPSGRARREQISRAIDDRFPSFGIIPKLFISAQSGKGVDDIWKLVDRVGAAQRRHIQTASLNQLIGRALEQQAPPMVKGKRPRIFYAAQSAISPPTITIFTSNPEHIHASYERYLTNQIRAAFDLDGVPLRLRFRSRRKPGTGAAE